MTRHRTHWLQLVAAKAGLELPVPNDPDLGTLRRAWVQAARAWKISEEEFARRAAGQFKLQLADLGSRDPQALRLVPKTVCERFGVLPLWATDAAIAVATSDPSHVEAYREIERSSGRTPQFQIAPPYPLGRAIEEAFPAGAPAPDLLRSLAEEAARSDFQVVSSDGRGLFTGLELESPAVVKLGNLVLGQAVRLGASEIHLEPGAEGARIRLRLDGVPQDLLDLSPEAHTRLVARLKHQAMVPGRPGEENLTVKDDQGETWSGLLRSTDTPHGELLTVRLSRPGHLPSLQELGLSTSAAAGVGKLLSEKGGLILVSGLAQSGKSTFIYAALRGLSRARVVSLENPVEVVIPGITQIEFDPGRGMPFAQALQQLLDQNPEVIHAGELRDLATARTALRAALTGRKVLATVHAVDAVAGIRRLLDMGLAPGRLAESLAGVVSLRLVRRLCPDCSLPHQPGSALRHREQMLSRLTGVTPGRTAEGCARCASTGFRGQILVGEVLVMDAGIRALLSGGPSDDELRKGIQEAGTLSPAARALDRVRAGETTLEEVERVLGVLPPEPEPARTSSPILVVDDDPQDRMVIRAVLEKMGYPVVEAEDGPSALRILEKPGQGAFLVVLDLAMPGMKGQEVLRRIREMDAGASLPVLVLTGSPRPEDEVDLLEKGADDYVLKPVVGSRLEARVRALLRRSGIGR